MSQVKILKVPGQHPSLDRVVSSGQVIIVTWINPVGYLNRWLTLMAVKYDTIYYAVDWHTLLEWTLQVGMKNKMFLSLFNLIY